MLSVIYSLIYRQKQFVELKQRASHSFMRHIPSDDTLQAWSMKLVGEMISTTIAHVLNQRGTKKEGERLSRSERC